MTDSPDSHVPSDSPLIYRPPFQLRSLPVEHRWEVTRRHPYYQQWWKAGKDHHEQAAIHHQTEPYLRAFAVVTLGSIGVSGSPPDPATDFDALGSEELKPGWLSGAVHPISFRGLAALMIAALPQETLGQVGLLLCRAAYNEDDDSPPSRPKALLELTTKDLAGLDDIPDEPIVSINPAASHRQIEESLRQLLPQWKGDRNLAQRRDRSDKFNAYLKVWDLREGWRNGGYDRSREMTLQEIADELNESVSTVYHHYRRAFELIVGHEYTPALWCRVFGILKLSELYGHDLGPVSGHRPLVSPSRRDVPNSAVAGDNNEGNEGPVERDSVDPGGPNASGLISKILRLIAANHDDDAILTELDLSPKVKDAVAYLRQRGEDFSQPSSEK